MDVTRKLSTDEVWRVVEHVSPIDLLAGELTETSEPAGACPAPDAGRSDGSVVVGDRYLLGVTTLRALRSACLGTVAARTFVTSGATTAAVVGAGLPAELQVSMLCRYVPGISHLTVATPNGREGETVTQRVVDELDLAGIGHSVTSSAEEAVFGANLVVVALDARLDLEVARFVKGSVVVNSSGRDLPKHLVAVAHQVCFDDLRKAFAGPACAGSPNGCCWSSCRPPTCQAHRWPAESATKRIGSTS